mgnify:CR=1 FL=1
MPEKKKEITGSELDKKAFEEIVALIFGLILIGALVGALTNYFGNLSIDSSIFGKIAEYFLTHIWPKWKLIVGILCGGLFIGILNNAWQLRALNLAELAVFNPTAATGVAYANGEIAETKNTRWEKILALANSENPSDRRMAVIEADVMLEELLETLGYQGDSVGEILKSVDKNQFSSIDAAWEAHKVRNTLVHSGATFELSERETKRVIALFEEVFREFAAI